MTIALYAAVGLTLGVIYGTVSYCRGIHKENSDLHNQLESYKQKIRTEWSVAGNSSN